MRQFVLQAIMMMNTIPDEWNEIINSNTFRNFECYTDYLSRKNEEEDDVEYPVCEQLCPA